MTASLPQARRAALEDILRGVGESLESVTGPSELENLLRYQRLVSDKPWSVVEQTLRENGKVLWVVNTVDRAFKIANEAETRSIAPLVYHGRVIAAFRENQPVLAITTQVAEMSLDLSADLLVTELAPIASLIQRLGRLNRRATPTNPIPPKPFLILEPDSEAPYKTQDQPAPFAAARVWLRNLGTLAVSQADLARTWIDLNEHHITQPFESAWLDGGFETTPRHLRESVPGLTILLEKDADAVARGEIDPVRVRIPMNPPRNVEWKKWREVAFARVPPSEYVSYDPERGARWNH
jgi:CRISPR-associated endonuclease/helicase Cas3